MSIFEYNKEEEEKKLRKAEFEFGREEGRKEVLKNMLDTGKYSLEEIAEVLHISIEEVKRIKKLYFKFVIFNIEEMNFTFCRCTPIISLKRRLYYGHNISKRRKGGADF